VFLLLILPLALFIKEERKKRGISARTLSDSIGRSPSYISQIERGAIKVIPYSVGLTIVSALGLDQSVLNSFYDVEEMTEDDYKNHPNSILLKDVDLESLRENFEFTLIQSMEFMEAEELAGLLYLFNSQRDLLFSLSQIPNTVKGDKVAHVFDMVKKYTKFMKREYRKIEEKKN
jgi:transcriptional regulator with XRE-family HTH domain